MNAPPRYELFVLEDGEKSVEVIEDTKIPNAATIKIVKQDHTLGNMLRAFQTNGTITPQEALEQASNKLIASLVSLEQKFKREFTYKGHEADGTAVGAEDPYGATGTWSGSRDYMDL
ncbi:hypothetical protein DFP72DRAFT_870815 [Ephemerocybe angulata]|uniref:DNA-directed RNA polymerase RBP11-like dimerisation domain-containing protein n=1 Tax=Ephemerocybe angulata TaxID=980116 RepID=A0A8H6MG26_9AGAR|nr:hypothetical protein DFP72DRAFT_870815 [Tulosesus angulatus]